MGAREVLRRLKDLARILAVHGILSKKKMKSRARQ